VVCCLPVALRTVRRLLAAGGISPRFVLLQFVFIIFAAGSAVWYLYVSNSAGWTLSLLAVANWFAMLISATILLDVYAMILTVGRWSRF
jgi:hypothetical protein